MKSPFFLICDDGEVILLHSAADTARAIEPEDARSGEFKVYDSDAREMKIDVQKITLRRGLFGRIIESLTRPLEPEFSVLVDVGKPPEPDVLAKHLRRHCSVLCGPIDHGRVQSMSLSELLPSPRGSDNVAHES